MEGSATGNKGINDLSAAGERQIVGHEMAKTVQLALLERARDLAGGVSFLARRVGLGVNALDAMLVGSTEIPYWVFLRSVEFVNEAEEAGMPPPGFPEDWQDRAGADAP
jgi:hypothetical protein